MIGAKAKYDPVFAEEILITYCYGTQEEIKKLNALLPNIEDVSALVEIITLIEQIKLRNNLTLDYYCCHRCQHISSCPINWRRGECKLEKHCCPRCENYEDCRGCYLSNKVE